MSVDRRSHGEENIRMMAQHQQDTPGGCFRERLQEEARITQERVRDTSRMEKESRTGRKVGQDRPKDDTSG
ncbi:hypothetical protein F9C28_02380 [Shimwellia pseudoproteus]|nr:hypothetical protein [Shimwellia pseudoproteus]